MEIESKEIKICPYWRKYVVYNGAGLAFCGRRVNEKISPLAESDFSNVLPECPWYKSLGEDTALTRPVIIEIADDEYRPKIVWNPINQALRGEDPFDFLERIWDQEVEKFIQRHSDSGS